MPNELPDQRIGCGYDLHRLRDGGTLILGGVPLPCDLQTVAHSDGDVLIHAVIDALLGALALGDLGSWFPDTNAAYADADSRTLLATVLEDPAFQGWRIANCDCNLIAERPRIGAYRQTIRDSLAACLALPAERVSVKIRSNEGCDAIGRGEALAAQAIVLLIGHEPG